jgi:hypothetical protein
MPKHLEDTPTGKESTTSLFDILKNKPFPEAVMAVFNTIAQAIVRDEKSTTPEASQKKA